VIRELVTVMFFVTSAVRLPEDETCASKHVAVVTVHKILLIRGEFNK